MTQVLDLVPIWTLILALAVFFYVLLDGFDLGVGMLYGFASDTRSRNAIMTCGRRPRHPARRLSFWSERYSFFPSF